MILQTGFRTDIPAFYSEWFANRLRAGYVLVRNPYNPQAVTRYELNPDVVDLIGFCTKNPAPMLPKMDLLRPYGQYWFVTITPYGPEIEPHVPPKETVLRDFIALSEIVGPDSIGWRYDPIFLSDTYTIERHIQEFTRMAAALVGHTHCARDGICGARSAVYPPASAHRQCQRDYLYAAAGARIPIQCG